MGFEVHPDTEHLSGQLLDVPLNQCAFQVPHLQWRPVVPPLFAQPLAVNPLLIFYPILEMPNWHKLYMGITNIKIN